MSSNAQKNDSIYIGSAFSEKGVSDDIDKLVSFTRAAETEIANAGSTPEKEPVLHYPQSLGLLAQDTHNYFSLLKNIKNSNSNEIPASFAVLKRTEGSIISVSSDSFIAEIYDLDSESRIVEQIEVDFNEISSEDHELLVPGAVFYWHIGYSIAKDKNLRRVSEFRFRRMPAWSRSELEQGKKFAKRIWGSLFDSE